MQQDSANGDIVVRPVSSGAVSGGTFSLSGPLTAPATKNPDGSVALVVQVMGAGRTKVFNLNALPPDTAHATWRWTPTPDVDLVSEGTDRVAGTPITQLSLDMANAVAVPGVSASTTPAAAVPEGTASMRAAAGTAHGAAGLATAATAGNTSAAVPAGMDCNVSTWTTRLPTQSRRRWIPVQRIKMRTRATQNYRWTTSTGTQMQVAYFGSNQVWQGGFAYSYARGTESGFSAWVTAANWSGYIRTRWRFVLQDQYCASTTWPYGAVPSGLHRWWPREWDGSSLPAANRAIWHCRAHTGAVTRYKTWAARSSTSRMNGQFVMSGLTLDAMQTNSTHAKHTFKPRRGKKYHMCGNTDTVPKSNLVKEFLP